MELDSTELEKLIVALSEELFSVEVIAVELSVEVVKGLVEVGIDVETDKVFVEVGSALVDNSLEVLKDVSVVALLNKLEN